MRRFDLHQTKAKAKTAKLVFWLVIMQSLTTLVIGLVFGYLTVLGYGFWHWNHLDQFTESLFPVMLVSTLSVMVFAAIWISLAAWWRYHELRDGGRTVARNLRAERIQRTTGNAGERQVLNIVEELAIAASIPAPAVFIMSNERGINALAAGHKPADAVVVVTEGACRQLSRDQMQGVIAHEFAHILNGDIGRNMLLMALSYGNYSVLMASNHMIENGDCFFFNDRDLAGLPVCNLLGIVLWPLGLLAATIALIFKALIKRQGEFHADASAVEYTRHPAGLADALRMIGGNSVKGRVQRSAALETSHLFFADNGWSVARWFDPHPSLASRILRLSPDWDGCYLYENSSDLADYTGVHKDMIELLGAAKHTANPRQREFMNLAASAALAAATEKGVGSSSEVKDELEDDTPEWISSAQACDVDIEKEYLELAADPFGAAFVLAAIRARQFNDQQSDRIIAKIPYEIRGQFDRVFQIVEQMDQDQRMLMFDTAYESVGRLSGVARQILQQFVNHTLIQSKAEDCPARWAWQWLMNRKLAGPYKKPQATFAKLDDVLLETVMLISHVIHADGGSAAAAKYSYIRAASHTGFNNTQIIPKQDCCFEGLEFALDRLKYVAAREKRKLLIACTASASSDREISLEEAWIMRAICVGLHYPTPKMLPGQPVTPGA